MITVTGLRQKLGLERSQLNWFDRSDLSPHQTRDYSYHVRCITLKKTFRSAPESPQKAADFRAHYQPYLLRLIDRTPDKSGAIASCVKFGKKAAGFA
ncbi:hypothetical protein QUB63_22800 [Microcoleus sp. ARI1-B5]|uniref:hypothetical protein n=1 Tax=unclassified Microcoleus TaxID=2642155 RepID=UPI002FD31B62